MDFYKVCSNYISLAKNDSAGGGGGGEGGWKGVKCFT